MKHTILLFLLLGSTGSLLADGVMIPVQEGYPEEFLKNKVTDVSVAIHGLIAETVVYQEFKNEWNQSVDGVYSFPLPQGARATRLQYTVGDSLVDAVLKIRQQVTNPGTGEGGTVSEINQYMGSNVLRIKLTQLSPNEIKGVRLSYISELINYAGKYMYRYPLNTGEFIRHPLDYLRIHIQVASSRNITGYDLSSHPGYRILTDAPGELELEYIESKAYMASDVVFTYQVENDPFGIELFSYRKGENDGYFCLVGEPPLDAADTVLDHHIIFILSNSNTMFGSKLDQSKIALSQAINALSARDSFNILVSSGVVSKWKEGPVPATLENIIDALDFVDQVKIASGNRLDLGLMTALQELQYAGGATSILAFSDGKSPINPFEIEAMNTRHTGIFFIAIGNSVDRIRLEATASRNYGFVSYIQEDNILSTEMFRIFQRIQHPLLKEVDIGFDDPGVYDRYPEKSPVIFAGTDFILTGRYRIPGSADISINGNGYLGEDQYLFQQDFSGENEFSRKWWAKMAIDDLEARILIYGENDSLKEVLTGLSLEHNIRCRYTAFTEVISNPDTSFEDPGDEIEVSVPVPGMAVSPLLLKACPNPFHGHTILEIDLHDRSIPGQCILRIYDINGRLIFETDLSERLSYQNRILLDTGQLGSKTGIFFVRLIMDQRVAETLTLIRLD